MNILEINSVNFGSTGTIMNQIAQTARNNGHTVYIAVPASNDNKKKTSPYQILIGNRLSRNIHLLLAYLTGLNGCFSILSTFQFLRKIKKCNINLIHLHNLHNCYINLPLLFRFIKKQNIKTIWTLHDCWSFTGSCPYFEMVDCNKWKETCHKCPIFKEYPESFIDNSKYMYSLKKKWFTGIKDLTIVTPSEWLAKLVKQSFFKNYPILVIHNGIDLAIFKSRESNFRIINNLENNYVLLGVASDWGKRKGLDVFVSLAEKLSNDYKIVLVGTNPSLDKILPKNIISIHHTRDQIELAEIYSAADIFINPTREEVLGLVNIEALACGIPVITFNSGGSPECIDSTCGTIVPKNDIDSLLSEIYKYKQENIFSKAACIARANTFNKIKAFNEYLALFK